MHTLTKPFRYSLCKITSKKKTIAFDIEAKD